MIRICIGLLLLAHVAVGQSIDSTRLDSLPSLPEKSNYRFGLVSEFGLAYIFYSLPAMNSFLRANQASAPNLSIGLNFTFGFRWHRLKLLSNQTVGVMPSTTGASNSQGAWVTRTNGISYIGLLLGYDVLNARNRRLYLVGGYGQAGLGYHLYKTSSQPIPFSAVFQTTPSGSIPSLLLENNYAEFGLEYSQREKRRRTASYVIKAGYRLGLKQKAWTSDVYVFTDPIADRVRQVYVQVSIALSTNINRRGN